MNSLRSPAELRVLPGPLGSVRGRAGQMCNRSVRIIQAAVAGPVPLSAHVGGGGRIQRSPRIGLGIPITSRQEANATKPPSARTPTRQKSLKSLSHQTSQGSCLLSLSHRCRRRGHPVPLHWMHGAPSRAKPAVDPRASASVLSFCRARLQSCNGSKYFNDQVAAPVEGLDVDEVVK